MSATQIDLTEFQHPAMNSTNAAGTTGRYEYAFARFVEAINNHATLLDGVAGFSLFAPSLDVTTFGAAPTATPEVNRAAFKAAMIRASTDKRAIFVPPGTYTIGKDGGNAWMLNCIYNNVAIRGVRGSSIIKAEAGQPNSATPIIKVSNCTAFSIADVTIDGNWGNSVNGTDSQNGLNHTTQIDPKNYAIWIYENTSNVTIQRVDIKQAYGDGIWIGGTISGGPCTNVAVRDVTIDMCARNGISLAGSVTDGVVIDNVRITNVFTTALDGEPGSYMRNVECCGGSHFGKWWGVGGGAMARNTVAVQGAATGQSGPQNYAENWSIHHCFVEGNISLFDAKGIHIHDNTITAVDTSGYPCVLVEGYVNDAWIERNQIYDKSLMSGSTTLIGAITVLGTGTQRPQGIVIRSNKIRARNTKNGVYVEAAGGPYGTSGTATATAALSMTDGAAAWTVNTFAGLRVRIGSSVSFVKSNTATVLTLIDDGWTDVFGVTVSTPAAAAYAIDNEAGVVIIDDNDIDCINDGAGAGAGGVRFKPNTFGSYTRITRNRVSGATGGAIQLVPPGSAANAPKLLEVVDNFASDGQPVATCTAVVDTTSMANLGTFVMRGNIQGAGVNAATSGFTSGYWLVHDGLPPEYAGYGSPSNAITAPKGSTYRRLDGAAGTTYYVNETGTNAWAAK